MPVFETLEPITAVVDIAMGDIRIVASERSDTAVEVRPGDDSRSGDVRAAAETRVEFDNGVLIVKGPNRQGWFGKGGAIDLPISLPVGSAVQAETGMGNIHGNGQIGSCKLKSGLGNITLDKTDESRLDTGLGNISVGLAAGLTHVSTGSGKVRITSAKGPTVIKNSNGNSWVGNAADRLQLSTANGDIEDDRAQADVEAKTANGNIRLGEIVRGVVVLATSHGQLSVGIRQGTAAHLDLSSSTGRVYNELSSASGPEPTDETVSVRARTQAGDVVIRRA